MKIFPVFPLLLGLFLLTTFSGCRIEWGGDEDDLSGAAEDITQGVDMNDGVFTPVTPTPTPTPSPTPTPTPTATPTPSPTPVPTYTLTFVDAGGGFVEISTDVVYEIESTYWAMVSGWTAGTLVQVSGTDSSTFSNLITNLSLSEVAYAKVFVAPTPTPTPTPEPTPTPTPEPTP